MVEKIKNFDFINASDAQVEDLLNEMVSLPKEELKEVVNSIVDTVDYKFATEDSEDKLPLSYQIIFNNEVIKNMLEEILKEYDENV